MTFHNECRKLLLLNNRQVSEDFIPLCHCAFGTDTSVRSGHVETLVILCPGLYCGVNPGHWLSSLVLCVLVLCVVFGVNVGFAKTLCVTLHRASQVPSLPQFVSCVQIKVLLLSALTDALVILFSALFATPFLLLPVRRMSVTI